MAASSSRSGRHAAASPGRAARRRRSPGRDHGDDEAEADRQRRGRMESFATRHATPCWAVAVRGWRAQEAARWSRSAAPRGRPAPGASPCFRAGRRRDLAGADAMLPARATPCRFNCVSGSVGAGRRGRRARPRTSRRARDRQEDRVAVSRQAIEPQRCRVARHRRANHRSPPPESTMTGSLTSPRCRWSRGTGSFPVPKRESCRSAVVEPRRSVLTALLAAAHLTAA